MSCIEKDAAAGQPAARGGSSREKKRQLLKGGPDPSLVQAGPGKQHQQVLFASTPCRLAAIRHLPPSSTAAQARSLLTYQVAHGRRGRRAARAFVDGAQALAHQVAACPQKRKDEGCELERKKGLLRAGRGIPEVAPVLPTFSDRLHACRCGRLTPPARPGTVRHHLWLVTSKLRRQCAA